MAMKLRQAIQRDSYTIDTLARIVQADATASAYLLNIANSPLYLTRVKADDIGSAIRILGVPTLSNLVTAYTLKNMVVSKNKMIKNGICSGSGQKAVIELPLLQ